MPQQKSIPPYLSYTPRSAKLQLRDRISQEIDNNQSVFPGKSHGFFPQNCVAKFINEGAIREELPADAISNLPDKDRARILNFIRVRAPKVFAIATICFNDQDRLWYVMACFEYQSFEDSCLPQDPRVAGEGDWAEAFPNDLWYPYERRTFYDRQWEFITPIFTKQDYEYQFEVDHILPVTWKHPKVSRGGFSVVSQVEIHPAHWGHLYKRIAIKEVSLKASPIGTEAEWDHEASLLKIVKTLDHPHIIKCIAAIRMGSDDRYFMFPWADGHTLRDYWSEYPLHQRRLTVIKDAVTQLRGLADGLDRLHSYQVKTTNSNNPDNQGGTENADGASISSIRHGDLKPENILRFIAGEATEGSELGVLKIADMGLAKRHVKRTRDRKCVTSTKYGTLQYEGPEIETSLSPLSRLYDIWSMGCIILDFIIWILYGNNELMRFNDDIKRVSNKREQYFEIVQTEAERGKAILHKVVRGWMKHIEEKDPECQQESALRDLLHLVKSQLLVVNLPRDHDMSGSVGDFVQVTEIPDGSVSSMQAVQIPIIKAEDGSYRATAKILREKLDEILAKIEDDKDYVLREKNVEDVNLLKPPDAQSLVTQSDGLLSPNVGGSGGKQRSPSPTGRNDNKWEFPVDNDFAMKVIEMMPKSILKLQVSPAQVCDSCAHLTFWGPGFTLEDEASVFKERATKCKFCLKVWDLCQRSNTPESRRIIIRRDQSSLRMTDEFGNEPVLTLLSSREFNTGIFQIGFPKLPISNPATESRYNASEGFFQIIRLWLKDCDNHDSCRHRIKTRLPKRLIDVGNDTDDRIYLYEVTDEDQDQYLARTGPPSGADKFSYIALSHPWGNVNLYKPFITLPENLQKLKHNIQFQELPDTFKHAVQTTRELKQRYLWIDSLCIIQGPKGDFSQQAKCMEDVFSAAYCVLAATRAEHQHDGFLGPRRERDFLTFYNPVNQPFYVCEPIDNFRQDVLEGSLCQRGWVLQERALARRTVFFAKTQTYFECGEGIRCETLGNIRQTESEFLGDPNFPQKTMKKNRGEKIRDFTGLYKQYSTLGLSRPEDRPVAIAGIESRLLKAYNTQGGYGIFDDGPNNGLFHRSLLWRRIDNQATLTPINFPTERGMHIPSWSWMGYTGGIDYFHLAGKQYTWEKDDIHPPWTQQTQYSGNQPESVVGIKAMVRKFSLGVDSRIIYDVEPSLKQNSSLECVIVARASERGKSGRHFILVVNPVSAKNEGGNQTHPAYKRVGVGFLPGNYIATEANTATLATVL